MLAQLRMDENINQQSRLNKAVQGNEKTKLKESESKDYFNEGIIIRKKVNGNSKFNIV